MDAIIIPAYKPTDELLTLIASFAGDHDIAFVVVDDGSGEEYNDIFAALPTSVKLLRHEVNRGKGAALKTAFAYVQNELPEADTIVTADADGQHTPIDILNVAACSHMNKGAFIIGMREFNGKVPLRSRMGNTITRYVFAAASGVKLYDTQTGLRAFSRDLLASQLDIPGDRYEFELNVLLQLARTGVRMIEVPITTVYLNNNSASHFNPWRDSMRIYICLLKYAGSSLISFLIDYVLVLLFMHVFSGVRNSVALAMSVILARVISAAVNFACNRRFVFKGDETLGRSMLKYALLAISVLLANYTLLWLTNIFIGIPLWISKIIVEAGLFFVSFNLQGRYVYRRKVSDGT